MSCSIRNCVREAVYSCAPTRLSYCALHALEGMTTPLRNTADEQIEGIAPLGSMADEQLEGMTDEQLECVLETALFARERPPCDLPPAKRPRLEPAVDCRGKRCEAAGCDNTPVYGVAGEKRVRYCLQHKEDGMTNVGTFECLQDGCDVTPPYGVPGTKRPLYCAKHKLLGQCDVKAKRCAADGCEVTPAYGLVGTKTATHCTKHKSVGMHNIKAKYSKSSGASFTSCRRS